MMVVRRLAVEMSPLVVELERLDEAGNVELDEVAIEVKTRVERERLVLIDPVNERPPLLLVDPNVGTEGGAL